MIPLNQTKESDNLRALHKTRRPLSWVTKNTAILVVHGIGNQFPLETLDQFGRGLVEEYNKDFPDTISITHCVVTKNGEDGNKWFDNVVRIKKDDSDFYIDLYEYYWANYTEDKAGWLDISLWVNGVVDGAKKFYDEQKSFGNRFHDESWFFDKNGNFNPLVYRFFIGFISKLFSGVTILTNGILKLVSFIPFIGEIASSLLQSFLKSSSNKLTNVLGDISVYNVVDPKSKFYCVRRLILDGGVNAIKFLIEKEEATEELSYPSIIIAGHSLGTQVSYDAINKINLLINQGLIKNYDCTGKCLKPNGHRIKTISDQLNGYITFGSPLDKIVFFLRERVPREQKLRQQLVEAYHGFKQLHWSTQFITAKSEKLQMCLTRHLDKVTWRNYYDDKDYVSGRLDYYAKVENINCDFKARGLLAFTHSNYWAEPLMYRDIILNFLKEKERDSNTEQELELVKSKYDQTRE